jgi:RimJ/RimL family protein N-acetyltransferase
MLTRPVVHRDNGPSRAVALRAGFEATGELRLRPRDHDPGPPSMIVYLWEA